jgi:hypothetical protein
MGIFHGIQSTIHIQPIVHSVLSVLLCLRMGRMGPDFMAIVMVRMMHGVMGIRFFLRHRRQLQVEVTVFMSVKGKSRLQLSVDERNPKHQLIPSGKLT